MHRQSPSELVSERILKVVLHLSKLSKIKCFVCFVSHSVA